MSPWVRVERLGWTLRFVLGELRAPARISVGRRLRGYVHGYRSQTMLLCGGPRPWRAGYLSDLDAARSYTINGSGRILLGDRGRFDALMRRVTHRIPTYYGYTKSGAFAPIDGSPDRALFAALEALLQQHGRLIAKPMRGTHTGAGVWILERDGVRGELSCGGEVVGEKALIKRLRHHVVTEFVDQAEYARCIYPGSTNTVRVQTMIDPDTNEAFAGFAVHRFGSSLSAPVDAVLLGGLSAPVDLETGALGPAVLYPIKGRKVKAIVERHPESGAPITGVRIPGWSAVLDELVAIATAVRDHVRYVGWDVVVTDDGFSIIEGNARTWFGFQANGPIFDDARIRRFFAHYGVVGARR